MAEPQTSNVSSPAETKVDSPLTAASAQKALGQSADAIDGVIAALVRRKFIVIAVVVAAVVAFIVVASATSQSANDQKVVGASASQSSDGQAPASVLTDAEQRDALLTCVRANYEELNAAGIEGWHDPNSAHSTAVAKIADCVEKNPQLQCVGDYSSLTCGLRGERLGYRVNEVFSQVMGEHNQS